MQLFYDARDDKYHQKKNSRILYWLDDLGAKPLAEARPGEQGFLFAGARSIEDYKRLVAGLPLMRDTAEEREPLLRLDSVLDSLSAAAVRIPMPKTWRMAVDSPMPDDLSFPLFVRTANTSWKAGGRISKVRSVRELQSEADELRRAFGWDSIILARSWLELAKAGEGSYGPIPQEVRVWIIDQIPYAWSFHYLNVVKSPKGFPPTAAELTILANMAVEVGRAFRSRLVAGDFARLTNGDWIFIEAGPGSCAGTAHEGVFKAVASRLVGNTTPCRSDVVGGVFD